MQEQRLNIWNILFSHGYSFDKSLEEIDKLLKGEIK